MIKIRAPIEPVLRPNENVFDDIEPGGQGVLPKIHTRDMPSRIIYLRSVKSRARPSVTDDPIVIAPQIFATAAKTKPVIELILGLSSRSVPVGVDVGYTIRHST